MSLNTIYDYKLWDSILGVISVTWEFSTDNNFKNIILSNTTSGNKLVSILPLLTEVHTEVYCRVKINGSNGSTDWFIVKEDKSNYVYITKGVDKYNRNIRHNKNIIRLIIQDKLGNPIHDFNYKDEDNIIYLTEYEKVLDLDFLNNLEFNTEWFYENIGITDNGIYKDQIVKSGNDFLILPILTNNNTNITSNIVYKKEIELFKSYIEIRLNLFKIDNSIKYITFKYNNENVINISNKDNKINIEINGNSYIILDNIEDIFYLIGVDTKGNIYLNQKIVLNSNKQLTKFNSIHIGNTLDNNTLIESEFKIDWIRVFNDTLLDDTIAE